METLGILHIADIHCGMSSPYGGVGDVKDKVISQDLRSQFEYNEDQHLTHP